MTVVGLHAQDLRLTLLVDSHRKIMLGRGRAGKETGQRVGRRRLQR